MDSHNFRLGNLGQPFGQIKPLPCDILKLVNDDVPVWKRNVLPLNLLQIKMGIIDHISKIDLVSLL